MDPASVIQLLQILKDKNAFLCTVESCTGGLLVNALTDISGSSEVVWGGLVTYDNSAKEELVNVSPELLFAKGAVSGEVALAMARGGLDRMTRAIGDRSVTRLLPPSLFISISLTGVAGPLGGTMQKPVGLCHIGLAFARNDELDREPVSRVVEFRSPEGTSRIENKNLFAARALELLNEFLKAEL